jgi:acyl-CoA synthetase (AMP-forming)/AMP-acid ligase II
VRNEGLGSWPGRRARMTPDRTALVFEGRATTYAELDERVRRLAAALRERGVGAGDRVAYLGPNHPAFLETFFATAALGAVFTHGNLTWNCYNLLIDLDLAGDEVALVSAPMFHTAALNHTALPVFLKGGTNVLVAKFDPADSYDLIAEHRITLMFGVPAMFQQIALSPRWADADLSSLRILHCGGAPVPGEEVDPADYYFRIHLTFETASDDHVWLNHAVAVGSALRRPDAVVYDAYLVA